MLPLSLAGQLAGAVVLLTTEPRPPYGRDDLPFLEAVAARAGSAVSHLRAFRQQSQIALDLQHSLLPDLPSARPGLEVAARYVAGAAGVEVGGDWWDVHHLGDDHVGVGLGDVFGRGVSAAIVMGHARAAMRAAAMAALSPGAILTLLDAQLADLMDTSARPGPGLASPRFATAVYADIDLRSGTARLANAGHPPLLLRAQDGQTRARPCSARPPLGLRGAHYEEIVVDFPPGAVLVGFTDGLVETRRSTVKSGLTRLEGYLRALETVDVDAIADGLLDLMSRSRELEDDIALVVLRRCEA